MNTTPGLLGATVILGWLACVPVASAQVGSVHPGSAPSATSSRPSQPERSPDQRAAETLGQMTLDEKIGLLHGPMPSLLPRAKRAADLAVGAGYIAGVERLGVPALVETDAGLGVSNLNALRPGDVATALPSGLALAASWDAQLVRAAGVMIGSEARAKGFNVMLVGGVNLVRDPRGGRTFEYLGEDPLLAGALAGAQIKGVQSNNIIATIKHFALNGQETGRNVVSVRMDEAAMRESDLLAFQIGIEQGDPGAVMCGYNRVNGVYACENPFLLNSVLRGDWGFKGFVMSDWGAVHSTEALANGLDQQSGEQLDGKPYFSGLLVAALQERRIAQSAVDTAARRILRTLYAHGLAESPASVGAPIDYAANGQVALKAAEGGIVLLRNKGDLLPLAADIRSIVVIGGNADIGVLSGGGSSQVTPVGGFRKLEVITTDPRTAWAKRGYGGTAPLDAIRKAFPGAKVSFFDGADVAAATKAAGQADIAIVVAEKFASEASDNADLGLEGGQDALIDAVAGVNARTVVVLETGNPVVMPWRDRVAAIIAAWYPGQYGGTAIANILTGAVNPSGRLPVTFPASVEQLPLPTIPGSDAAPADKQTRAVYGLQAGLQPFEMRYPEGSDVGYRWFDKTGRAPLYPFGFGLSYTRFAYTDLKIASGKALSVTFKVTNIGRRAGADVPQVYFVRAGRAKRLIGWAKPYLQPGQTVVVTVRADPRVLGDYDTKKGRWVVPAGAYQVQVAASAAEPVLTAKALLSRVTVRP